MNFRLITALIFLSGIIPCFSEPPAPTREEVGALMNKVQDRVASGDVSALDQLLTLPGNWAVPALLDIFEEHYNLNLPSATDLAMEARAAQLATSVAGGEAYLVKLLRKKPDDSPPWVFGQQDVAIQCLIYAHNNTAVRLCCGALDQPDIGGRAANALATMKLPGAPYSSEDTSGKSSGDAGAITKWKQWWKANANNYPPMSNPKPPASP